MPRKTDRRDRRERRGLSFLNLCARRALCGQLFALSGLPNRQLSLNAVFLNCTLKKSPEVSNTQVLVDKVVGLMEPMGVECETVRVVDYNIPFGVASNMGESDEWPLILDKILAAVILIIASPIWFGVRASVTQLVIERLDGATQRQVSSRYRARSQASS